MSRNDKKRGLLENGRERVEMEEEWIELDDFRTTPNPYVVDQKPSHRKVLFIQIKNTTKDFKINILCITIIADHREVITQVLQVQCKDYQNTDRLLSILMSLL
jgi:hypothetical protein